MSLAGDLGAEQIDDRFGGLMDQEIGVRASDLAIAGSPEQCAARVKGYLEAGVEQLAGR